MRKKILFIVIAMAILAITVLAGRQFGGRLFGPRPTGKLITLGRYYWPGEYWHEIAYHKGFFKQEGLNVELVDTNPDFYKSIEDTVAGKITVNNMYLFDFIQHNLKGADLVAIINEDVSFGSEALVAKPAIERIQDLRGKAIGVTKDSSLEYILSIALERSGLTLDDVIIKDMPTEKTLEAFMKGDIDAFIAWESYPSDAVKKAGARKLFDTSNIIGVSRAVLALKRSFVKERPGDVAALVRVWHKTTKFIQKNPQEAFDIIAKIYNLQPEEVEKFTHIDKALNLEENHVAFLRSSGFESLYGTAQTINDHMLKRGLTDKSLDCEKILDDRFIRRLK